MVAKIAVVGKIELLLLLVCDEIYISDLTINKHFIMLKKNKTNIYLQPKPIFTFCIDGHNYLVQHGCFKILRISKTFYDNSNTARYVGNEN